MRVVIQRVSGANVRVSDKTVGEIGPGLVLLVCFEKPKSVCRPVDFQSRSKRRKPN